MQKKAEVKKHKTNRGLMWQYDDQSGQVSERQKKAIVKTRRKSKEEYQTLLENTSGYKELKIKSGIYRHEKRNDLLINGIDDFEELKEGFQDINCLLKDYELAGNGKEMMKLLSAMLLGYTVRMFLGYSRNPDLLCSRAPVVLAHPNKQDFTGGFEHLAKIIECFAVDTSLDGKLHHHTPAVLPDYYFSETIDECAFLQTKGDKKKKKFPAQYRDTSVLIHSRFFKLSDIKEFVRRNPWATIIIFDRKKLDSSFVTIDVDMNLFDLSKRNWETMDSIKQMLKIRALMRTFAYWLSDVHLRKNAVDRAKYWVKYGMVAGQRYNFAHMQTQQKRIQGSELRYLWLQVAALRSFLDFCYEVGIIDEERQEDTWNLWCNALLPGSRDVEIFKQSEEKRLEEERKIREEVMGLYENLLSSFIETADEEMFGSRKQFRETYTDENYYRSRVSVICGSYSPRKVKITPFSCVIILKKDLVQFATERNPAFKLAIEKMWGSDYSSEDYRPYIYSVDTATLRRGLSPDAVVLYAEELSFLSSTVKNKILKIIQEEK